MESSTNHLPQFTDLSTSQQSFLGSKFQTKDDLLRSSDLVTELQKQCDELDQCLTALNHKLETSVLTYASHSERIDALFDGIGVQLNDLKSLGGKGEEELGGEEKILGGELPALAKEVARVETVRIYADLCSTSSKCEILGPFYASIVQCTSYPEHGGYKNSTTSKIQPCEAKTTFEGKA